GSRSSSRTWATRRSRSSSSSSRGCWSSSAEGWSGGVVWCAVLEDQLVLDSGHGHETAGLSRHVGVHQRVLAGLRGALAQQQRPQGSDRQELELRAVDDDRRGAELLADGGLEAVLGVEVELTAHLEDDERVRG